MIAEKRNSPPPPEEEFTIMLIRLDMCMVSARRGYRHLSETYGYLKGHVGRNLACSRLSQGKFDAATYILATQDVAAQHAIYITFEPYMQYFYAEVSNSLLSLDWTCRTITLSFAPFKTMQQNIARHYITKAEAHDRLCVRAEMLPSNADYHTQVYPPQIFVLSILQS